MRWPQGNREGFVSCLGELYRRLKGYTIWLYLDRARWLRVRYESTTNRWFESLDMIWETVQTTTHSWILGKIKQLCLVY